MVGDERRATHNVPQLSVRDALATAHDQHLELRQHARRPLDDRARRQRDVERFGVHVRRRDRCDRSGVLALDLAQDLCGRVAQVLLGLAIAQGRARPPTWGGRVRTDHFHRAVFVEVTRRRHRGKCSNRFG